MKNKMINIFLAYVIIFFLITSFIPSISSTEHSDESYTDDSIYVDDDTKVEIPQYGDDEFDLYDTTPLMIGLLLATNAIFTFIFAPIWGRASDKLGRKPMLVICQCGTTAAFLILAFSNSLEILFLSRIVDGIFGGNFTLVKSIISDKVPPKDRGIQMTNVGVVMVLAALIGPGLGGVLSIFGIIGPGLCAAGLSVITIIVTILYLEESWPKSKRMTKVERIKEKIKLRENKIEVYLLTLL